MTTTTNFDFAAHAATAAAQKEATSVEWKNTTTAKVVLGVTIGAVGIAAVVGVGYALGYRIGKTITEASGA